jgi:integrase
MVKPDSIASLALEYLNSGAFAKLAETVRRNRRYLVERFVAKYGDLPARTLKREHVIQLMDKLATKPGQARNTHALLSILMGLAINRGIRTDNPVRGVPRPKLSKSGWHTWTEGEMAQFEAHHAIGSPARLAFALALYTCQRSADLIRMGKQHVSGGKISVRQQKTGTSLKIPLHPALKAIMDATPSEHLTFLVSERNKPFKNANSFGHRMRLWARKAGLTGCPLHGLRKASCRRLAEIGCSAKQIMAISGHKSLREVEKYINDADQERLAEQAMAKLVAR